MFMPVHVRKRGDRLKPATAAQFFFFPYGSAAKILDRDTLYGGEYPL
jgi:hypothetical protein